MQKTVNILNKRAKFDYEKGKWFNGKYLQSKPVEEIADLFNKILIDKNVYFCI